MMTSTQAFQLNAPASTQVLSSVKAGLPIPLPDGYMAFLERANGGEGFIGERYVRLWSAEELIGMNRSYKVAQFFPDMFFIGTDGGGEAYAFKASGNDAAVFEAPFLGRPSDARTIADSFESFVRGARRASDFVDE